jgi:hypothetical protein
MSKEEREAAEAKDRDRRFAEVVELMAEDEAQKPTAPVWPTMLKEFGDGAWHSYEEVAVRLGIKAEQVEKNVKDNRSKRATGRIETKKVGSKRRGDMHTQFRIFPKKRELRAIEPVELRAKAWPLVLKLLEEGRLGDNSMSASRVRICANELRTIFLEWIE